MLYSILVVAGAFSLLDIIDAVNMPTFVDALLTGVVLSIFWHLASISGERKKDRDHR